MLWREEDFPGSFGEVDRPSLYAWGAGASLGKLLQLGGRERVSSCLPPIPWGGAEARLPPPSPRSGRSPKMAVGPGREWGPAGA